MPFRDWDKDEKLMTQFFNYAATPLYKYALKLLGDSSLAQDAVQSTFAQLLQYFDKVRDFSNERFLGYARKALLYQCISIAKQQGQFSVEEHLEQTEEDPGEPVVDFLERRATREEMRLCIQKLSSRYRFVLYLKYFENHSCREIGELLNLKENHVRTLLTRARAQLKRIYVRDILGNDTTSVNAGKTKH